MPRVVPVPTVIADAPLAELQVGALLAALAVAVWQVLEARRLREAQPFVVVDSDVREHLILLVVLSVGITLATNVRFEVTPPFTSTIEGYESKDLKMFREGIPTLPPGKEMRTLLDSFPQREQAGGLPRRIHTRLPRVAPTGTGSRCRTRHSTSTSGYTVTCFRFARRRARPEQHSRQGPQGDGAAGPVGGSWSRCRPTRSARRGQAADARAQGTPQILAVRASRAGAPALPICCHSAVRRADRARPRK